MKNELNKCTEEQPINKLEVEKNNGIRKKCKTFRYKK